MRGEPVFLGIYVKAPGAETGGASQGSRWHVWGLPDGNFLLQEVPADGTSGKNPGQPGADVKRLGVDEFFADYRVFAAFSAKTNPAFPHEKAAERNSQATAAPPVAESPANGAAHQDLVTFLTQGVEEDRGKDYVLVKGGGQTTPGIGSGLDFDQDFEQDFEQYQAQATILLDEEPQPGRAVMSAEEIAKTEQNFRTEFSLAVIRLKSKRDDALKNLESMAASQGPFAPEHKFMFSDCGLALRKRNLFVLAARFHERAKELAPDDEHVLFNLARAMYESGKIEQARDYLRQAVQMAPDFAAGHDFLSFIDGGMRPE